MNNGGGSEDRPACPACMIQRKRCEESCEFAPYFPASKYEEFIKAYNLFGLSNMAQNINVVEPRHRQVAADTMLFEGNVRDHDRVHGCLGVIRRLQFRFLVFKAELEAVNQQLAFFKRNQQQLDNPPLQPSNDMSLTQELSWEGAPTAELLETHPTNQTMDPNQNGNEITSVQPDEEAKNDGDQLVDIKEETKD